MGADAHFPPTRWSLFERVRAAEPVQRHAALGELCAVSWYPLYVLARRRGLAHPEAEDQVQALFARLIEAGDFARVDRARGSFRTWIRAALEHQLSNVAQAQRALKRGGDRQALDLDFAQADARYASEFTSPASPERDYERAWACERLASALQALRAEYREAGRELLFAALEPHLQDQQGSRTLADTGLELGVSQGALRVALYRLRTRYRELLRQEVARTLDDPGEVDDELRTLLDAFS